MDFEPFPSVRRQSEQFTFTLHTIWDWSESLVKEFEEKFSDIEKRFHTTITFSAAKQIFELKGTSHDQLDEARQAVQKILLDGSAKAKQVLIVPSRRRKPENSYSMAPLQPLNFHDSQEQFNEILENEDDKRFNDTFIFDDRVENPEDVLGWTDRKAYLPVDYWAEISKETEVEGDVILEERKIDITGINPRNVAEAIKRLQTLETLYLQPPFKPKKIPLVHYPNQKVFFKLHFHPLKGHKYFRNYFQVPAKDPHVLVAVTKNEATGEYDLPPEVEQVNPKASVAEPSRSNIKEKGIAKPQRNFIDQQSGNRPRPQAITSNASARAKPFSSFDKSMPSRSEFWSVGSFEKKDSSRPPIEVVPVQQGEAQNNEAGTDQILRLTEEQRLARKDAKKTRLAEMRRARAQGDGNTSFDSDLVSSSSDIYPETRILAETEEEKKSKGKNIKVQVKNIVLEKNPNSKEVAGHQSETSLTHGKLVRNYNFEQMKNVFTEGLEHARAHKGEIKFYGHLGKVLFIQVPPHVTTKYWEFTDLKDVLMGQLGISPMFTDVVSDDARLIKLLTEILATKPYSRSSFFEINAEARNSPHGNYIPVSMYVNMGFVSLEKVMLRWQRLVDVDWSVLDRKFDFQMSLAVRKSIRHDVKPFSTFIKKTSVHPPSRVITFENVHDYLHVKSINLKDVTRFKLHYPFVAELTLVEQLPLVKQSNSKKVQGRTGDGKRYYNLEILNDLNRDAFKNNSTLPAGQVAEWTVDDILGPEPHLPILVEFVKAMLLLVERCNKAADERAQELEKQ
ncbi:hypothetical protein G9A89_011336 [Geosiphon pyriformis]|nr:hypothetical protein G9A89_011336 [Geosiphon pyriformis]